MAHRSHAGSCFDFNVTCFGGEVVFCGIDSAIRFRGLDALKQMNERFRGEIKMTFRVLS
jgi:hypothetical protein